MSGLVGAFYSDKDYDSNTFLVALCRKMITPVLTHMCLSPQ